MTARKTLYLAVAVLLSCLLPGAAFSNEPGLILANPIHEVCNVLAKQVLSSEPPDITFVEDGCDVKNGQVAAFRYGFWIFDRAELRGVYAEGSDPYPSIPSRGNIKVVGVRFIFGKLPGSDYLSKVQQAPLTLELLYHWDRDMKRLRIDHAVVASNQLGVFGLSASLLLGFNPMIAGLVEPQERSAAVEAVSLKLDNKGLFEMYAMGPVVSSVGYDVDPEPIIKTWKDHQVSMLDIVPSEIMSASTADAIKRFITDVPHPKGVAGLSISFTPPMSVLKLALGDMSINGIFGKARVEGSYPP